jgi:hypothetical protein
MTRSDDDELSPAELAAAEAVLRSLERGAAAELPDEAADLGRRWIAVAIVEGAAALDGVGDEIEALDGERFAVAADLPAGDAPDAAAVRRFVGALRAALGSEARAVVVTAPGLRGERAILGPGPDAAAALFRRGLRGVVVDPRTHAALGEPAEPVAGGFRLAARRSGGRRWILAAAAVAAAVLLALVPLVRSGSGAPPAFIYVAGDHAGGAVRGGGAAFHEADTLHVTVEAPAGGYVSLLLLDSHDRLQLPAPDHVNARGNLLSDHFTLDDQPGREQFLAVVSREPLPDLDGVRSALNGREGLTRAERIAALREGLAKQVSPDAFTLVTGTEILHER